MTCTFPLPPTVNDFVPFFSFRGNFPADIDIKCIYHPVDHPYCPVFRVRDILTHANESFSTIARQVYSYVHILYNYI